MKTPFRWKKVLRGVLLTAAVLGLYVPAMSLLEHSIVSAQKEAAMKLPEGISVASAQTSWQTLLASGR